VRFGNGAIDTRGQTEIVGVDDQPSHGFSVASGSYVRACRTQERLPTSMSLDRVIEKPLGKSRREKNVNMT
jgi:hypothetical protein